MEAIQVSEFNDDKWKIYAKLLNDLNIRYSTEKTERVIDWPENKNEVLGDIELLKNDLANHYLVFENGSAVGWFARRVLGSDANFVFDALYDEIPESFLQTVFKEIVKFLEATNKEIIYTFSPDKRIVNSMMNAGATKTDTMVYSRLMKNEVDAEKLNDIVNKVSGKLKYKLVLYNDVTEEIIDRYLDIYNEARVDMNHFNPEKKDLPKRNKESLINKLKYDKGPNDKMFMYMLFDNDNIAAFSSLYIRKENENVIDHGGGLTTVNRKYRGQNLARFLKVKLYLKMLEEFPDFEYIKTDTYPWNKHMYRINEEMGFKPFKEYSELKISGAALKNKIK